MEYTPTIETNADGTTDTVQETVSRTPDGAIVTQTNTTYGDGGSSSVRTQQNPDGSSETHSVGVDKDGNSTTTQSTTAMTIEMSFVPMLWLMKAVNRSFTGYPRARADGRERRPSSRA